MKRLAGSGESLLLQSIKISKKFDSKARIKTLKGDPLPEGKQNTTFSSTFVHKLVGGGEPVVMSGMVGPEYQLYYGV